MTYHCVRRCDGRLKGLISDWENWLQAADKLYTKFSDRVGASPFFYHEISSVSFLSGAAMMAGYVSASEYEIRKRGKDDKRLRVDGRADLWFSAGARCYSFEFKRAWVKATEKNLGDVLNEATTDIARIQRDEYHYAAGALIARIEDESRMDVYETFAQSQFVDFAVSIGPRGEGGAYLFFKLKK